MTVFALVLTLVGCWLVVGGVRNPGPIAPGTCSACGFRFGARGAERCPECGLLLARRPGLTGVRRRSSRRMIGAGLLLCASSWAFLAARALTYLT